MRSVVPRFFNGLLNLSGFEVGGCHGRADDPLTVVPRHPIAICPHCRGLCGEVHQTRDLDGVRDLPLADRAVELRASSWSFGESRNDPARRLR